MGFVFESGNPGLAAAARGAAEGIETAREVQDQQQAREMAMTELQLRQQRGDLAMDAFSERLRKGQADEARADLRLVSDIEARKVGQSLSQQKFDKITELDDREQAMEQARGEANSILLRVMGDGTDVSPDEYRLLTESLRDFDPVVQSEILMKAKGLQASQRAASSAKAQRNLAFSEKYILSSGSTPEETAEITDRIIAAQLLYRDDPEGYADAIAEMQGEVLQERGKRQEIVRWGDTAGKQIEGSVHNIDEKQEAYMLRAQILEIGATNPNDPRIDEFKERVDWLSTPMMVREATLQGQKKLASANAALSAIGMAELDQEQMASMRDTSEIQRGITSELIGGSFARTEEERGQRVFAGLKAANMDIGLDVLLPVEKATDQQLEYAFQSIEVANMAMQGVASPETILKHMDGLFERSGIVADKASRDKYSQWLGDRGILDAATLDPNKIVDVNIYKDEARKDKDSGRTKQEERWMQTFEANKRAEEAGVATVPLGEPPIGIRLKAALAGWRRVPFVEPVDDTPPREPGGGRARLR